MIERKLPIVNRLGLHARAAAKLVHLANQFESDVSLVKDGEQADAKSILGILLLAAAQGTTITVRVDGQDEAQTMEAVSQLISGRFGEES